MRLWHSSLSKASGSVCYRCAQQSQRTSSTLRRTTVADVLEAKPREHDQDLISVDGFVRSVRRQKNIAFAAVGDGSSYGSLQAVLDPQQADALSTGTAVRLTGHLKASLAGKQQSSELRVQETRIWGDHDATAYPLQKKYHSPEFLRTIPHLRARSPQQSLLLRLRSHLISQATSFFEESGYVQTQTPLITSSDCEGAGEVFTVKPSVVEATEGNPAEDHFFSGPKYLTVSSQLHLEALCQAVGDVWTLSPTFRAERSDTARHLSEFYMLEAEACFVESASSIMDLVEALVRRLAASVTESKLADELLKAEKSSAENGESGDGKNLDLASRWKGILSPKWNRITYHEAVKRIQAAESAGEAIFREPVDATSGLATEHEKFIAASVGRGSPVFVTDYPAAMKPFYMAPSSEQTADLGPVPTVACFDLLMPDICEVVGGSMREHRLDALRTSMAAKGVDGEELEWYLDLRRFGSVPHGGFGLGFDRLLAYLSGTHNIRDVVTFPRWHGRCVC